MANSKSILTFNKGMNSDLDKSLRDGSTYYRAENFTLTPSASDSVGAFVNTKGNIDTGITFALNHEIVGYVNLLASLIVFTTDGTDSAIYEIENPDSDSPVTTLVYNDSASTGKLNFNTSNPITAVPIKESENIRKVYWVDGVNDLRYINLDEDYTGVDASIFNMVPPNDLEATIKSKLLEGGNYTAGVVQHAFQFYRQNGADSTVSNFTVPLKLTKASTGLMGGTDIEENTFKSVKVDIENISNEMLSLYNRVKVFSLFYSTQTGTPVVSLVGNYEITTNSISIVDSNNPLSTVDLEELVSYKETSFSADSIATKNDNLFLANVKETSFTSTDIDDWDSRAYRFDSSGEWARVYDVATDTPTDVAGVNNPSGFTPYTINLAGDPLPLDHDAFNKYNSVYELDYVTRQSAANQYKYTGDGTSIGGEGTNVKFTFDSHHKNIATLSTDDLINYKKDEVFTSLSTFETRAMVECQAGEIYRVGIKFFNDKGQSSFVKWVGDILFEERPEHPDANPIFTNHRVYNDASTGLWSQVHVLKVDIKNMPADPNITGWQLVRVKRNRKDSSILASGIAAPVYSVSGESFYRPYYHWNSTGAPNTMYSLIDSKMILDNSTPDGTSTFDRSVVQFISPDLMMNGNNPDIGECRVAINAISDSSSADWGTIGANHIVSSQFNYSLISATSNTTSTGHEIEFYRYIDPQHAQLASKELSVPIGSLTYLNQARSLGDDNYAGANSSVVIKLDTNIDIGATDGTSYRDYAYASILQNVDISRYDGVTYEARLNNSYIEFSEVYPITTTTAYGTVGDVWSAPFDLIHLYYQDSPDDAKEAIQHFLSFSTQSRVDVRYRSDRLREFTTINDSNVTDDKKTMFPQETVAEGIKLQPDLYDENIGDLYKYNTAYSTVPEVRISVPKPFDFPEEVKNGTKVINSEKKINGESVDNWLVYKPSNFIEVNSSYGDISNLKVVDSNLFFWQESAFGRLAVNDRYVIGEGAGQLALGSGGVLERFDYISTDVGCSDKFAISSATNSILWYDSRDKRIYSYGGDLVDLSTVKGVTKYLDGKNTVDPIMALDDHGDSMLFKAEDEVLAYDLLSSNFSSVLTFNPKWIMPLYSGNYLSSEDGVSLYKHYSDGVARGNYYGVDNKSTIKHICSSAYPITKVFDNVSWASTSIDTDTSNVAPGYDFAFIRNTNEGLPGDELVMGFYIEEGIQDPIFSFDVRLEPDSVPGHTVENIGLHRRLDPNPNYSRGYTPITLSTSWQTVTFDMTGELSTGNQMALFLNAVGGAVLPTGFKLGIRNVSLTHSTGTSITDYIAFNTSFPDEQRWDIVQYTDDVKSSEYTGPDVPTSSFDFLKATTSVIVPDAEFLRVRGFIRLKYPSKIGKDPGKITISVTSPTRGTGTESFDLSTGDWYGFSFSVGSATGAIPSGEELTYSIAGNLTDVYQGAVIELTGLYMYYIDSFADWIPVNPTYNSSAIPNITYYPTGVPDIPFSPSNQYEDTFDRYRFYDDYQNTDWQDINWKRKERTFTSIIPRDRVNAPQFNNVNIFEPSNLDSSQTYKRRMRDKYLICDFEYDNTSGNVFSCPYIVINYRQSIR